MKPGATVVIDIKFLDGCSDGWSETLVSDLPALASRVFEENKTARYVTLGTPNGTEHHTFRRARGKIEET